MIIAKDKIYKKAFKEVYELINILPEEERINIPKKYIENIQKNMDNEYIFIYDITKSIEEQNFMNETKAIIIDLYIKYFSQQNEKELWIKYQKKCEIIFEEEKRKKYNPDNIFKKIENNAANEIKVTNGNLQLTVIEEKNYFKNIIAKIKKIISKIINGEK